MQTPWSVGKRIAVGRGSGGKLLRVRVCVINNGRCMPFLLFCFCFKNRIRVLAGCRPRGTEPAHGATDLENPPSASCGHMSVESCKEKCMEMDGCTAITISAPDAVSVEVESDGVHDCAFVVGENTRRSVAEHMVFGRQCMVCARTDACIPSRCLLTFICTDRGG